MGARSRWPLVLVVPIFGAVFLAVRAVWDAYRATLNESELHLRVFDHATAVSLTLWSIILLLTLGLTWWVARRLAPADRATSNDRAV